MNSTAGNRASRIRSSMAVRLSAFGLPRSDSQTTEVRKTRPVLVCSRRRRRALLRSNAIRRGHAAATSRARTSKPTRTGSSARSIRMNLLLGPGLLGCRSCRKRRCKGGIGQSRAVTVLVEWSLSAALRPSRPLLDILEFVQQLAPADRVVLAWFRSTSCGALVARRRRCKAS